jgi:hypothetical protein
MSVLGEDKQNWIKAILGFSNLVGPPALWEILKSKCDYYTLFWVKTKPGTISVSSIVPPNFLETLISLRSISPFKVFPEL